MPGAEGLIQSPGTFGTHEGHEPLRGDVTHCTCGAHADALCEGSAASEVGVEEVSSVITRAAAKSLTTWAEVEALAEAGRCSKSGSMGQR